MSITDELRKWWVRKFPVMDKELHNEFAAIADRIDAAHRSALEKLAAQVDESEDGWVRLPVDADGVPINFGDVMEVKFDTKRRPFTVSFVGERAVAFWVVGQHDLKSFNLDTVLVTHYHAPTVEDVLREFADRVCNSGHQWGLDAADTIAEFAAKLRLREENE